MGIAKSLKRDFESAWATIMGHFGGIVSPETECICPGMTV